jgi:hypothetical protein
MDLRNVGNLPQHYTTSQPTRARLETFTMIFSLTPYLYRRATCIVLESTSAVDTHIITVDIP